MSSLRFHSIFLLQLLVVFLLFIQLSSVDVSAARPPASAKVKPAKSSTGSAKLAKSSTGSAFKSSTGGNVRVSSTGGASARKSSTGVALSAKSSSGVALSAKSSTGVASSAKSSTGVASSAKSSSGVASAPLSSTASSNVLLTSVPAPAVYSSTAAAPSTCTAATADTLTPLNPGINVTLLNTRDAAVLNAPTQDPSSFIKLGCSETATVWTQTRPYTGADSTVDSSSPSLPDPSQWPRTSCPHADPSLVKFESLFPSIQKGDNIVIPSGSNVLLRGCALPLASQTDPTFILGTITVQSFASLVIDDSPLLLRVLDINVQVNGTFSAGSPTCRLFSKIEIIFHGFKNSSSLKTGNSSIDNPTASFPTKGMNVNGNVDIHGKLYFPTWTRLARTALINDSVIHLQEGVNWEVGQEILVTTTILLDCDPSYEKPWCVPCFMNSMSYGWDESGSANCPATKQQNEIRTIKALAWRAGQAGYGLNTNYTVIQLDRPLNYKHYAGFEYQAEVALLSRRILVRGDDGSLADNKFGGHIMVAGSKARGRLSGVQAKWMGQLNQIARYPFHFHMMGDNANTKASYFEDLSVTHSFFRAYTIHGSNGTRLSRSVAYNVWGMAVYLEDGVEEHNLIEYNMIAHVHPIYLPANDGYGQSRDTFLAIPDKLAVPVDVSASPYYSLNANNAWIGNAASGGWAGFAFPNAAQATGPYASQVPSSSPWAPHKRPLKRFVGNSAHSAGYHWIEHGSLFYCGAWLDYDANGVQRYLPGRHDRSSVYPNGTKHTMIIEHFKGFLGNKGVSHWGNQVRIENTEVHDIRAGAMLFGSAAITNMLINGGTPNLASLWVINRGKFGFQFYDTWVQTILSNVVVRNFTHVKVQGANTWLSIVNCSQSSWGCPNGILYMDHSDHYTPQGINSVRNIVFQNVTRPVFIDHCGTDCGTSRVTMSSRIYSVWDFDGSLSRTGRPVIMGGNLPWWDQSPELPCFKNSALVYQCDWYNQTTVAFIGPAVAGLDAGCDSAVATGCTDQYAPYFVGRITQWNQPSRFVDLVPWAGVSGYANTAWHWRVRSEPYAIEGAPSSFRIDQTMQLARGDFVILSITYPAATQFTVALQSEWYYDSTGNLARKVLPMASSLSTVLTPVETLNAPSTFTCGVNWYDFCNNTGGVGPAWYFDNTNLYLRVVHPAFYNRNNRNDGDPVKSRFTVDSIFVPNIKQGFTYRVDATCSGCDVNATRSGVTYWSVADALPQYRFASNFGSPRAMPAATIVTPKSKSC